MLILLLVVMLALALASPCFAELTYTPLITSADFTGIHTDVLATATGIISVLLVIVGLGLLVKMFTR